MTEEDPTSTMSLAEVERAHIEATLAATGGNRKRAAELLKIDVRTLYRRLEKWAKEDTDKPIPYCLTGAAE